MVLFVLRPYAADWLGLSQLNVDVILLANASYCALATWNATRPAPSRRGVRVLATANASWTVVSSTMAVMVWSHATWLGLAYIVAEGTVTAVLAVLELRASRAL